MPKKINPYEQLARLTLAERHLRVQRVGVSRLGINPPHMDVSDRVARLLRRADDYDAR